MILVANNNIETAGQTTRAKYHGILYSQHMQKRYLAQGNVSDQHLVFGIASADGNAVLHASQPLLHLSMIPPGRASPPCLDKKEPEWSMSVIMTFLASRSASNCSMTCQLLFLECFVSLATVQT